MVAGDGCAPVTDFLADLDPLRGAVDETDESIRLLVSHGVDVAATKAGTDLILHRVRKTFLAAVLAT